MLAPIRTTYTRRPAPPPEPEPTGKLAYSVAEAAELLGVSRRTLDEALLRNEIPSVRLGRRRLVPRAGLDAWLTGEGR